MTLASKSIVNIMRNWNGVIYMSSSQMGLKSLIESLNQPIRPYKKLAILDTLIDIFNIPIFVEGSDANSPGQTSMTFSKNSINSNDNLLNNYVALLL
jgi:hypothetical protein